MRRVLPDAIKCFLRPARVIYWQGPQLREVSKLLRECGVEYGAESRHAVQQVSQQMAQIGRAMWQPRIPFNLSGRNQSNQMLGALNLFLEL